MSFLNKGLEGTPKPHYLDPNTVQVICNDAGKLKRVIGTAVFPSEDETVKTREGGRFTHFNFALFNLAHLVLHEYRNMRLKAILRANINEQLKMDTAYTVEFEFEGDPQRTSEESLVQVFKARIMIGDKIGSEMEMEGVFSYDG